MRTPADEDRAKRVALLLATDDDVDWERAEYDEGERWCADITLLAGRLREVEQRAEKAEAAAREMAEGVRDVADSINTEVRMCAEEHEGEGWPECPVCAETYRPWRDGLAAVLARHSEYDKNAEGRSA